MRTIVLAGLLICAAAVLPVSAQSTGEGRESGADGESALQERLIQIPRPDTNREKTDMEISSGVDFEVKTEAARSKPGEPVPFPELVIESLPSGAEVYINFTYAGVTPLTLRNINPGGYRITLRKPQYKPASVFLSPEQGRNFHLRARLQKSTGTLRISAVPADAEIFAGTKQLLSSEEELPVGVYDIRVRRFGYEEYRAAVTISEDRTTHVEARLTEAPFSAGDFSVSRRRLNPDNPGLLGRTEFSFTVTAQGKARLSLADPAGREVFSREFPSFSTWQQSFLWDGKSDAGDPLPNGRYRAVLSAESLAGGKQPDMETEIEIDKTLVIRYRNIWHGLSGLMYAPSAAPLPAWDFQISSNILGLNINTGGDKNKLYLFQVGGALGIINDIEVIPSASIAAANGEEGVPDINGAVGIKYRFFRGNGQPALSLAVSARGIISTEPSYAGFSQFPGFSAGAIGECRMGPFGFLASPEFQVSPYPLGNEVNTGDTAPRFWMMGRFGFFYDGGSIIAGISTALAFTLFPENPAPRSPLHTGLEIHGLVPNSPLNFSAFLSWEHYAGTRNRIFFGGGIGIIY